MRKYIYLAMAAIVVSSCGNGVGRTPEGQVNPDNKKEWKLVWEDNFDYKSREDLLEVWKSDNQPHTHILCSRWEENVEVGDGVVRLVNRKENRGGQEWTSASLTSYKDFQYGYFECRYKYAAAAGTNNSFWLMTRQNAPAPTEGKRFEIDINEGHYPNEVNTNIHNWTDTPHKSAHKAFIYEDTDFSKDFHVLGLEWTAEEIIFFLDGNEIRRSKNEFSFSPAPVLLSMAVIQWAGEVTDAVDGTYMEVDYVRVYEAKKGK